MDKQMQQTSGAEFLGYSEWRPMRWRVTDATGRNYGLFANHAKATRFAEGVMDSYDVDAVITRTQDTFLVWDGDNIGCSGDIPATVMMHSDFGHQFCYSVRGALEKAREIDEYGLNRIVSALRLFAGNSQLHPDDLSAWRELEADFPVFERGEVL